MILAYLRRRATSRARAKLALAAAALSFSVSALAGNQVEEGLSANVQASLHRSVSDYPSPGLVFVTQAEGEAWLKEMSHRLEGRIPDPLTRRDFLVTVQYEATRAGLDPQLVLGVIQHESNFRKYAVSVVGARGFMQVMPFWVRNIGNTDHDLFNLRTNLRYGCIILRYYLDVENGDMFRALGRYNGSLGRPEYPNAVLAAMQRNWTWSPGLAKVAANVSGDSRTPMR